MKRLFLTSSTLLLAMNVAAAEMPPPKVLQISREQVKPGKSGAVHEKIEAGWPRAMAKVNSNAYYIGMTSVTGPSEAWFVTGWPSFAAFEKDVEMTEKNPAYKAELDGLSMQDGELLSSVTSVMASYNEELSYRPAMDIAKMRYFSITTYRVNPGRAQEFVGYRRLIKEAHEKAKIDEHFAVYQVNSGGFTGTYLLFAPMKTMAELDSDVHGKPYQEALGDAGNARVRELAKDAVLNSFVQFFAFNPKMSYLSKEMVAGDPDFWTPKPTPAAKPEAKK
jgi:hypothetical protein